MPQGLASFLFVFGTDISAGMATNRTGAQRENLPLVAGHTLPPARTPARFRQHDRTPSAGGRCVFTEIAASIKHNLPEPSQIAGRRDNRPPKLELLSAKTRLVVRTTCPKSTGSGNFGDTLYALMVWLIIHAVILPLHNRSYP